MSEDCTPTHVAFADESHWNTGRYRSLGMVTLRKDDMERIETEIRTLLVESGVHDELKWSRIRQARDRFAAHKICDYVVEAACRGVLRVDVLMWDTTDSRHDIHHRDDIANLQRMYYHLFRNVLRNRWPYGSIWRLHPDENTAMEWASVQDFLDRAGSKIVVERDLLSSGKFNIRLWEDFKIISIEPAISSDSPLVQLADLFAGLCVFSRENYQQYATWLEAQTPTLFADTNTVTGLSSSVAERYNVLCHFDNACKQRRLGVSIKRCGGLRTFNPENPINFWWYVPQTPRDKAPTKE